MKIKLQIILSILVFFSNAKIKAQIPGNVIVNVVTTPPYSPYLTDYLIYENQTIITITAIGTPGVDYSVYLKGSIVGDNGVSIKTNDSYIPNQSIMLTANIPKRLTGIDLKDFFDWSNVKVTGVSIRDAIRNNGVPEGNYTICFQVYDYQTKQMIGVESCSSPISIQHVNPPTLVSPVCESEISSITPQTLMFSWTYNPGVTVSTRYLIKMVELLETQNPNDAINSQTTPAFFEKTVSSVNYLYTAIDPVLKPGKKYAWRVKAFDLNNKIKFKNNGESEVCVFSYKSAHADTGNINQNDVNTLTSSKISGKAHYFFMEQNTVLPKPPNAGNVKYYPLKKTAIQLIEVWSLTEVFKVKKITGKDSKGNYIYTLTDSLVPLLSSEMLFGSTKPSAQYPKTINCGKVVASTFTDEEGNYHFDIPATFKSQILDTFFVSAAQSTDGKAHHAAYATGLWIKYNSPYYYSSGQVLYIQGKVLMDDLTSVQQAKNYALKVNLKNYNQSKNYYTNKLIPTEGKTSDELDVYLLKLNKSFNGPYNECDAGGKPGTMLINNKQYLIYAQKSAKLNASVTFIDLVQNIYPSDAFNDDAYYIYAKAKDAKNVKYQPTKFSWNSCPFNDCFDTYQFDINMSKYVVQEMDLSPYHISLAVSGKLKKVFSTDNGSPDLANSSPLANVPIKLVGQWVIKNNADGIIYPINGNSYDFASGITNSDGEFSLNTGNTTFSQLGANGMNQYQNSTGDYYAKDGTTKKVSGKEYYVLRIKVQSQYYYSPDNDLLVEPGYNYELGDLYAYVREANVKIDGVKAVNTELDINQTGGLLNPIKKGGERVYLCVNTNVMPDNFPLNENKLFSLSRKEIESFGKKFKVIDETTSGPGGVCSFKHVVLNDQDNVKDRYLYFSESPDQSFDNYNAEEVAILKAVVDKNNEQKPFTNSKRYLKEYNMEKDLHQVEITANLYTWAQTPLITGAVYPESNYSTNPLSGVTVEVYDIPEAAINEIGFGQNGIIGALFKSKLTQSYGIVAEASMQTSLNGKFQFNVNTSVKSKTNRKLVYFTKCGFTPYGFFVNGGAVIKKGQKAALSKIFMELPAVVLGKVVDAVSGEYIHAKVVVGEDFSWSETQEEYPVIKNGNMYIPSSVASSQKLSMTAPRTNGVKFTVYPLDNDTYEPLIENHDIKLFGDQPSFTFKVKHRQHHVVIRAHAPGSDYIKSNLPIKATVININPLVYSVQGTKTEKDQDNKNVAVHEARLFFSSPAKTFLVKIESLSEDACYETKIVSIEDDAKYQQTINFELKPCKKVICHVEDDKGNPAVNVKIYVEDLPYTVPEVYTNVNGDAELIGIPANGTHTIVAIPPIAMKNYYGARKSLNMNVYNGAKVNFKVNYFNAMDITTLLGFPIEVKNIAFGVGNNFGKFYISGSILIKNGNSIFKIPTFSTGVGEINKNNNFDFEQIEITASSQNAPSGLPYAVPKKDFWSTTTSKAINVLNDYDAYSYSLYGAFVKKTADNAGKIQSPVFLESSTFKKGFAIKEITQSLYISNTGYSGKTLNIDIAEFLDLFNSDGTKPNSLGNSFKLSTWDFKNVNYKLHNRYDAEAKIAGSFFDKEGLHLNTVLHTNIPQLANPDIMLEPGQINVTKTNVEGISSTKNLEIAMDKWKFAISNWTLDESGFNVTGKILAGALTVPAKKVLIEQNRFNYGIYEIENIKLGGNVALNIDKNNSAVSFGFDAGFGSTGSWSLSMLPLKGDLLTSIKNLPGLNSDDKINIKNISLFSKGTDDENVIMLSETTPWVTVHGVSKFHPSMAFASTGIINFRGKLDLQIPKLSEMADAFTLRYEAKPNGLTLNPPDEPFSNLNINTIGVNIVFDTKDQIFIDNKLVMHGKIYDQNPSVNYTFNATLTKSKTATTIVVDGSDQKFVYSGGASGLEKITGSMELINNNTEWNNFSFEGDLYGLSGIAEAKKHMKFKVEGDLVANDQNVGVNNIAIDGLGTGSITYDFNQKALIGSLHIDRDLSNCHLAGDVDLKFGGGDWYVFGSTLASNIQNSPVNTAKCGFFVGKGTINANIQKTLAQYFYQQLLPDPFPKGSYTGALFCTEAALPVPIIPQLNINLDPIVHCVLEHAIHLNSYTGISLDFPKISYDLGGQLYAYIHAGAGASVGIACAGADFAATAGAGVYGHIDLNVPDVSLNPVQMMSNVKQAIINANITMQGEVFLNLQGTAYVGGGLCDSDCDGYFCETTSWSKGADIILSATYKKGEGISVRGKKWNFH